MNRKVGAVFLFYLKLPGFPSALINHYHDIHYLCLQIKSSKTIT